MTAPRFFRTSAELQDLLLQEAGPGTLVVAPHQRLAQQLWQRQRRAALAAGRGASGRAGSSCESSSSGTDTPSRWKMLRRSSFGRGSARAPGSSGAGVRATSAWR